jgi:geranylgeranyl diphosphate synthase type II
MTALAFELIASRVQPADAAARIVGELASATNDMIAGQVLDTLGGGSDEAWTDASNSDRLRRIHLGKTGALIRAACRIGALSAGIGEDTPEFESLSEFGLDIGLMFQIVDDLLDVEQQASHVGKATGKDRDAGKLTYPSILGVGDAKSEVRRLEADALDRLACLGPDADPLREFCRDLAIRTK